MANINELEKYFDVLLQEDNSYSDEHDLASDEGRFESYDLIREDLDRILASIAFVDSCLEETAVPGIYYMGTQGGYITPPLESLFTENSIIPYYYNRGFNAMPPLTAWK